ncbi:kinase-like domain-containing protein [Radiomyces spectabilis]|uniref:kinase-like domain-containing protein n=1 Tax=Radiomyces spectabilis TaxID=64574 RepID=UPI00221ED5CD|nr:kinase-like domain-containing protein [Radiomyces spectabilis]KAI8377757.1 kinase-like domain-containing protein [Radiomyces spectabilis]
MTILFWSRPEDSPEVTTNEYSENRDAHLVFGDSIDHFYAYNHAPQRKQHGLTAPSEQHHDTSKRRQTKMLLVSLIESFCRIYGDSPEANRRVFFLICQTLSSLGIIDTEFVDEMTSVRSTFHKAFQKLFHTAVQTVRKQEFRLENQQRMIAFESSTSHRSDISSSSDLFGFQPSREHSHDHAASDLFFNLNIQNSRYRNDFVQISMLGKGGFASAWRARNKLDDIEYAVKKIRLGKDLEADGTSPYEKIFREIKNLARLEHHNVVRYYSSWLEYAADDHFSEVEDDLWDHDESSSYSVLSSSSHDTVFNGQDPTFDASTPSFSSVGPSYEELSRIDFVDDDGIRSPYKEDSTSACNIPHASSNPCSRQRARSGSSASRKSHKSTHEEDRGNGWTLFIQMQLCPSTLHDYIKFRNRRCIETDNLEVNRTRIIEIFSQILEGAAYIHEQGLIHRDLKPSNIFLGMPTSSESRRHHHRRSSSGNHDHGFSYDSVLSVNGLRECMWEEAWVPKIGDFGLAAAAVYDTHDPVLLPSSVSTADSEFSTSVETPRASADPCLNDGSFPKRPKLHRTRTSNVGTRTYASPEQLANPPQAYCEKTDIYSLGIIFFELYQPFATAMERAEAIDHLKRGVFPEGFVERYPKESALILWMMDENPAHRPSAVQLLEFELFAPPMDMYSNLQAQLQAKSIALDTKTREMAALRNEMQRAEREKQREMDAMRQRLEELQRQLDGLHVHDEKKRHHENDASDTQPEIKRLDKGAELNNHLRKFLQPPISTT